MADLNYKHLRYFWAVAHDGNLTRTAERLNVSQSALSVQIRALEERLGHRLFERQGRQLHLTEAGRLALDHADTIFAAGGELLDRLSGHASSRQALRVGALATLSRNFQIGFLRPLLGRSDVEIVLRSGNAPELMDALEAIAIDVVLTNHPPAQDAATPFITHRLDEQRVGLFGAPHLVQDEGLAEMIAKTPLILPLGGGIRAGFDSLAARLGVRPQIAAEVDDMAMIRLLVREGVGVALVPGVVVADELAAGRVAEAGLELGLTETFYAVTLDRRFPNTLLAELLSPAE